MERKPFLRPAGVAIALLGLMTSHDTGLSQEAADKPLLQFVAESGDARSRTIAVGVSSLAKVRVDAFDIDITWVGFRDDPLEVMRQRNGDLGLLSLADPNELDLSGDLTAVMKAWQAADEAGSADDNPGYLLVTKADTDAAQIRQLLEAVQSDDDILNRAGLDTERLAPSIAMADLPLPLHQGARDYLATAGSRLGTSSSIEPNINEPAVEAAPQDIAMSRLDQSGTESPTTSDVTRARADVDQPDLTPLSERAGGARSYVLYFDTDEATIDDGHISSVARACRHAAKLPRARFVISGHTDTAGSVSYNADLAKRRANVVADAIRNDPRFREALSVVEFGEAKPALKTEDGVSEQLNRRVVITILPDP